ncbi:LysR substrate-binding domain-containing protein [Pusillimonas sp. SM2304]|uniref:LysR substrate-binding domain-containing protein n=1 Tax=Pusillimonas sp. SM2304 TaxID=3073241 RepID=UPI0028762201|nr:LysR substrate-binding domain-containing protein [Pusillimonas sp. SM2304]MDS1141951.1 LysR substrate-binding domain-containing protein [Pusillimonas sp. SM2304]
MNLKQLQYFVRVFEMQNMTRAAESLHVAQPALSQQIALLEDDLGVRLLTRGAKGVQATNEGALLYRHAQTILRQVDTTRSLLAKSDTQIAGTVSIGLASSTARMIALPLMKRVKQEIPGVVLEIVDIPSADLTKLVLQGRVDFSLSPDQQAIKGIAITPLMIEDLYLLTHASVKLPAKDVPISQIVDIPLILPSLPNQLRARVDHAFMLARLTYHLFAEASTSAILIPAVREGLAATILPYSSAHPEITNGIIRSHSLDFSLSREISLCASISAPENPAVQKVVSLTKAVIKQLIHDKYWPGCKMLY